MDKDRVTTLRQDGNLARELLDKELSFSAFCLNGSAKAYFLL